MGLVPSFVTVAVMEQTKLLHQRRIERRKSMANKRTVDPTASEASTKIVGIRVTDTQLAQISLLCEQRNVKRSQLIRDLVRQASEVSV